MVQALFIKCFPFGSLVRVAASFTRAPTQEEIDLAIAVDLNDWQPQDPETVKVRVLDPDGAQTTKIFLTDVELVNDAVGEYHYDVDAQTSGTWSYRWESTGVGQAAAEHTFTINATAFTPGSP